MTESSTAAGTAASATSPISSTNCPNNVPWCASHDPGDFCWSRTVQVREAALAFSNGTTSGRPKLWGLGDFENDALELDVAEEIAAAIIALAAELAATNNDASSADWRTGMAAHSWTELFATTPYGRYCGLHEANRDDLGFVATDIGDEDLEQRVASDNTIGGILVWEGTPDHEGGSLVMLSGQTVEQEQQVIDNAGWLISCGAIYAPDRVGWRSKSSADWTRGDVDEPEQGLQYVWQLPNDHDVDGMLR